MERAAIERKMGMKEMGSVLGNGVSPELMYYFHLLRLASRNPSGKHTISGLTPPASAFPRFTQPSAACYDCPVITRYLHLSVHIRYDTKLG
jgi:hypothetical protein